MPELNPDDGPALTIQLAVQLCYPLETITLYLVTSINHGRLPPKRNTSDAIFTDESRGQGADGRGLNLPFPPRSCVSPAVHAANVTELSVR